MAAKELNLIEAIGFGWKTALSNLWFFVGLALITGAIYVIEGILVGSDGSLLSSVLNLIFSLLNVVLTMGTLKIALRFCDGQKGEYADLYRSYPLFWKYLGGAILYSIMVIIGSILLVVPGVIVALQFGFFGYLVIDKNLGVMDSLKMSSKITNGAKWKLFGLFLLSLLINIAGAICLIIGLFVTVPTTMLAWAYAYRKLSAQA